MIMQTHSKHPLPDDALEPVLVPLDGLGLVDLVTGTNLAAAATAPRDALTWAGPLKNH